MNDAVGGQVDAITDNLPSVIGHIKASRLRPLAVMAALVPAFCGARTFT